MRKEGRFTPKGWTSSEAIQGREREGEETSAMARWGWLDNSAQNWGLAQKSNGRPAIM